MSRTMTRTRAQVRPTRRDLLAAAAKSIPDVIAPGLKFLFCGINPGLYSAAIGCHFGRPGNRFWRVIHRAGFTDRLLDPSEQNDLLHRGCGITNLVERATATADEIAREELVAGALRLREKVRRLRPRALAVLGIGAYRTALGRSRATVGRQPERMGETEVWVLPNPSGLNAHYQIEDLVRLFRAMKRAVEDGPRGGLE